MPKLIGHDEQDEKIQVPAIAVVQPTPQPQEPAPTNVVSPGVDVPQQLIDNLANTDGIPGATVAPPSIDDTPLPITLPNHEANPFGGMENAVQQDVNQLKEDGLNALAPDVLEPLNYGLSQRDQQLQHWIEDQRNEASTWQPVQLPQVLGRDLKELDPSVAGGFKPTSQDKPWWGDFEPTTEWNPLQGKFGDFGKGLLPGIFQALNSAQAVTQGIGSDIARVGAGIVGGLERIGVNPQVSNPASNVFELTRLISRDPFAVGKAAVEGVVNTLRIATKLPEFSRGFQDNYSRLSPAATGQKPLSNLPSNNILQKLRNQSYAVSGLTGRNLSATDESVDEKGRFNPLGQRQAANEKQKPTVISNVGARLSAEAASVTSFVAGQGFLSKQQKESVYQDVRTSQIGGFARGLAVDVISGEALERLVSTGVKKTVNTFVRRVGKPIGEAAEVAAVAKKAPTVVVGNPNWKPRPYNSTPDFGEVGVKPSNGYVAPQYRNQKMWEAAQAGKKAPALPPSKDLKLTGAPERRALPPTSSNPERTFVVKPTGVWEVTPEGQAQRASRTGIFKDGELQPVAGEPFKESTQTALSSVPERAALPEQAGKPSRTFVSKLNENPFDPTRQVAEVKQYDGLVGETTTRKAKNPTDLGEATSTRVGQVDETKPIETVTPEVIEDPTVPLTKNDPLQVTNTTNVASRNVKGYRETIPVADAQVFDPERYVDEWFAYITPEDVSAVAFKVTPQEFLPGAVNRVPLEGFAPKGLLNESTRTTQTAGSFTPKALFDIGVTPTSKFDAQETLDILSKRPGLESEAIDMVAQDVTEKRLMWEAPQRVLEGYDEVVPGVFALKASDVPLEAPVGRSTPWNGGTPSEPIVTPSRLQEMPGAIEPEVFSPQMSLGDLADAVTKQQPGMTYNATMAKRGQRKLDSMISLAQKVMLPDGSTIIPQGSNGINTWAKFYNRINHALSSLSKDEQASFKRIFTRDGVPLPEEIPDSFVIRVGRAKADDTQELVSVVKTYTPPPVTSTFVSPEAFKATSPKTWAQERLERIAQKKGTVDDLIEPDLTQDKVALSMYQRDLPKELVVKSNDGVKLTNQRLITENEIAHLSDELTNARKDFADISKMTDEALKALDTVPDAGARTLLEQPLDELFNDVERIGKKYQTPEEIAAFEAEYSKAIADFGAPLDVKATSLPEKMYHGSRADLRIDPLVSEPRGDLGVGHYIDNGVDNATASAKADVRRNTPPVEGRVYGEPVVSTVSVKRDARLIADTDKLDDGLIDIFVTQAERLLADDPAGDLAVKAYRKHLTTKPTTVAEAYALIESKLLKASKKLFGVEELSEKDMLKFQRAVAQEIRESGIDGVTHKEGVVIYNPLSLEVKKQVAVGESLDTLELALHRLNTESAALARNPKSPYLMAQHAEAKARVLGELQDKAHELLTTTEGLLDNEVQRLLDLDKAIKAISTNEIAERVAVTKNTEETAYQSFKNELNKKGDTPCL